jgi:predicted enzyme related to lactoylglutathione lyase
MSATASSKAAGKFVWYDQMSHDMMASAAFYKNVIGWNLVANTMNDSPYTVLAAGEAMIGGVMPIPEDSAKMGVKAAWMGYIGVADVDAFADKVKAAGGAIHRPPTDIPGVGRFAVASDPTGAGFILFNGQGAAAPPHDDSKTGHFGWRELHAGDREAAFAFYSRLFGWTKGAPFDMGPMGIYQLFDVDGQTVGGMMTKTAQAPVPHWLYYINVDAADAAAERVKANGGQVLNGPHQVPTGQWALQAADSQGAVFGLLAPVR